MKNIKVLLKEELFDDDGFLSNEELQQLCLANKVQYNAKEMKQAMLELGYKYKVRYTNNTTIRGYTGCILKSKLFEPQINVHSRLIKLLQSSIVPNNEGFLAVIEIKQFCNANEVLFNAKITKQTLAKLGFASASRSIKGNVKRGYVGCCLKNNNYQHFANKDFEITIENTQINTTFEVNPLQNTISSVIKYSLDSFLPNSTLFAALKAKGIHLNSNDRRVKQAMNQLGYIQKRRLINGKFMLGYARCTLADVL